MLNFVNTLFGLRHSSTFAHMLPKSSTIFSTMLCLGSLLLLDVVRYVGSPVEVAMLSELQEKESEKNGKENSKEKDESKVSSLISLMQESTSASSRFYHTDTNDYLSVTREVTPRPPRS